MTPAQSAALEAFAEPIRERADRYARRLLNQIACIVSDAERSRQMRTVCGSNEATTPLARVEMYEGIPMAACPWARDVWIEAFDHAWKQLTEREAA